MSYNSTGKLLAVLGGIIAVIQGVLALLFFLGEALSFNLPSWSGGVGALAGIAGPLPRNNLRNIDINGCRSNTIAKCRSKCNISYYFWDSCIVFYKLTRWCPRNPGWNYNVLLIFSSINLL